MDMHVDTLRTEVVVPDADPARWDRHAEAHHRLANSLLLATVMLRDESRHVTDSASARVALDAASLRLMAMSRLHWQLSRTRPEDSIDLAAFLEPIRGDVADSLGASILLRVVRKEVPVETATQIAVILNELATNAVKHRGAAADVTVAVDIVHDGGGLRVMVEDDGPGLPHGFDIAAAQGLGMRIVGVAVERMGGTIRTVTSVGAAFEITLPAA